MKEKVAADRFDKMAARLAEKMASGRIIFELWRGNNHITSIIGTAADRDEDIIRKALKEAEIHSPGPEPPHIRAADVYWRPNGSAAPKELWNNGRGMAGRTAGAFNEDRMRSLLDRNEFMRSKFNRMTKSMPDENALRAIFETEVSGDPIMMREYRQASVKTASGQWEWSVQNVDGMGIRMELAYRTLKSVMAQNMINRAIEDVQRKARSDLAGAAADLRINLAGLSMFPPVVFVDEGKISVSVAVVARWMSNVNEVLSFDDVEEIVADIP
jgi:hypothetical protein